MPASFASFASFATRSPLLYKKTLNIADGNKLINNLVAPSSTLSRLPYLRDCFPRCSRDRSHRRHRAKQRVQEQAPLFTTTISPFLLSSPRPAPSSTVPRLSLQLIHLVPDAHKPSSPCPSAHAPRYSPRRFGSNGTDPLTPRSRTDNLQAIKYHVLVTLEVLSTRGHHLIVHLHMSDRLR